MSETLTDQEIEELGMTDEQMERFANSQQEAIDRAARKTMQGVGAVTEALGKGLQYIDAYSPLGAPLRSAIVAPEGQGLEAYKKQYGEDPSKAPSGATVAKTLGVPDVNVFTIKRADPFTGPAVEASLADVAGAAGEFALDPTTYLSGGLGKAAGTALGKTGAKMSPRVAQYLANLADERAAKAATGQSVAAIRKMGKVSPQGTMNPEKMIQEIRETGRALRTPGPLKGEAVLTPFADVKDIALRGAEKTKQYGAGIGEIGKLVDERIPGGAVSGKKIAEDLLDYAAKIPPTSAGKLKQEKILAEAENFMSQGNMSFRLAQDFKGQFEYKPTAQDLLVSDKDISNKIKEIITKNMDDAVLRADSPELLAKYQLYKNLYGKLKEATQSASARSGQDLANRLVSPSSHGIGAATMVAEAATGAPGAASAAKGILAAAANQFALNRGNSASALLLGKISERLASAGPAADKFIPAFRVGGIATPEAFLLRHKLLMQSDPEYRAIITGNSQEQTQ